MIMHSARYHILAYLDEKREPQFVEQIAKATKIHPRMVSHHLDVLEENGLISSEYKLIESAGGKREVAVRMCKLLPKYSEVKNSLRESLEEDIG